MPETSYAPCGDLSLAYQVFGDGPVELVWAGSFTSHVELFWTMPEFGSLMEQLGTFARVLLFDKAGAGLSDPVPKFRTLDERAAEIEAVMARAPAHAGSRDTKMRAARPAAHAQTARTATTG